MVLWRCRKARGMSIYQIEVDDKAIKQHVIAIINRVFIDQMNQKYSDTGEEISKAVREIIYEHKDEIVEKVVDRAATEISKKALPKLIERLSDQ